MTLSSLLSLSSHPVQEEKLSYLEKARQIRVEPNRGKDSGSDETLSFLFKEALGEIKAQYVAGLLEHIRRKHPEIHAQLQEAEGNLETIWARNRQGLGSLETFEESLSLWKGILLAACEEHRVRTCQECKWDRQRACAEFWKSRTRGRDKSDKSDQSRGGDA